MAGKSDPYCVLSLSASPSAPFLTTSVKEETLFPVWQETGSTYVPRIPAEPTLHVKVMDHDRFGKHDLLGRVDVKLNRLTSGKRYDQWFRVEGSKTSAGMLSVAVRRAKNVPAMDRNGNCVCARACACACTSACACASACSVCLCMRAS